MSGWDLSKAAWRKSTRSADQGGTCIEVAAVWQKSSHSANQGGECIEVATADQGVAVRDSKDPDGAVLCFGRGEWAALIGQLKS